MPSCLPPEVWCVARQPPLSIVCRRLLQMAEDSGVVHGSAAGAGSRVHFGGGGGACAAAVPLSTPVQWAPQVVPPSFGAGSRCRRRPDDEDGDEDDEQGVGGHARGRRARSSATRVVAPEVTMWRLMNAQRGQVQAEHVAGSAPHEAAEEAEQQMLAAAAQARGQTRLTQFFRAQLGADGGAQAPDDAMVE